MDFKDFIECLYVNNQLDSNFGLKELCPQCNTPLQEVDDNAYPYYCPKCELFINKSKTEGIEKNR